MGNKPDKRRSLPPEDEPEDSPVKTPIKAPEPENKNGRNALTSSWKLPDRQPIPFETAKISDDIKPQPDSILLSLPSEMEFLILRAVGRSWRSMVPVALVCRQLFFAAKPLLRHLSVNDFEIIKVVGSGNFCKVFLVKHKQTGGLYCLKRYPTDQVVSSDEVAHMMGSIDVIKRIGNHPFLQKVYEAWYTPEALFKLCEYFQGGELFYALQQRVATGNGIFYDEYHTKIIVAEIASALVHAHKSGVVLRGVKPEDIVLDKGGHCTLCDYNLSKVIDNSHTATFAGTPEYISPEILQGQPHNYKVDFWALGTLAFELFTGLPPFHSPNIQVLYHNICESQLQVPPNMPPKLADLITKLLDRDQNRRLGGEDVKKHPFFEDIDWAKLERRGYPLPALALPDDSSVRVDTTFSSQQITLAGDPPATPLTPVPAATLTARLEELADFDWIAADSPLL